MSTIDFLWFAWLNRNADGTGSDSAVNLTINIDGEDVFDQDDGPNAGDWDGEAYMVGGIRLDTPFDSALLTNSSVRVGVRGRDAWGPGDVLVFGHSEADLQSGVVVPLAMESGLTAFLSTDPSEGPLTLPLRLIRPGMSSTVIRRVLMVVHTEWSTGDPGTDSPIQLEVFAGENLVLREEIDDTSQSDLEAGMSNWYVMDALAPFTRGEVQAGGRIVLSILGDDAWKPHALFIFGLDTASGRPNEVVSLVSLPVWGTRQMSTDPAEGDASVDLPVTPG
jgi:hypothetical protein